MKARHDPRTRIRKLDQIELWEISIVTFPLLPGARKPVLVDPTARRQVLYRRAV